MGLVYRYHNLDIKIKATIWYLICNTIQKSIQFITIPLYVRILTTAEYGNYNVFMTWKDVLIIPITLNLYCGVYTKAMVDYEEDRDRYTSSMQGLGTMITLAYFVMYIVFYNSINHILGYNTYLVLLLFLYYITYPAFSFWITRQRVEYRYKRLVCVTVVLSILTPALSLIFYLNSSLKENALICGTLIVQIIIGSIFYVFHMIHGRVFFIKKYWIYALKYNIPLLPHYLSMLVLAQVDRIMIKNMCGSAKAGIYSVAYQISSLINFVVDALNGAIVPWLYGKYKAKDFDQVKKITNMLCLFIAILSMIAILIAPEIIQIVVTDQYIEAIWIIPAVALSAYYAFCNGFFISVEMYYGATKNVMFASGIGALANIILNFFFIRKYGFIAAGYTTLICYILLFIIHYCFMKNICRDKIGVKEVYDEKIIFFSAGIMFLIMLFCLMIYNNDVIRYFFIILTVFMLIYNNHKILSIIKQITRREEEQ